MYDIIMWFVMSDMRGLQIATQLQISPSCLVCGRETLRLVVEGYCQPFPSPDWKGFLQCKTSGANHLHTKVTGGFVSIAA